MCNLSYSEVLTLCNVLANELVIQDDDRKRHKKEGNPRLIDMCDRKIAEIQSIVLKFGAQHDSPAQPDVTMASYFSGRVQDKREQMKAYGRIYA